MDDTASGGAKMGRNQKMGEMREKNNGKTCGKNIIGTHDSLIYSPDSKTVLIKANSQNHTIKGSRSQKQHEIDFCSGHGFIRVCVL
jgi:hypothetical protein